MRRGRNLPVPGSESAIATGGCGVNCRSRVPGSCWFRFANVAKWRKGFRNCTRSRATGRRMP
jgi:hypothetical protein